MSLFVRLWLSLSVSFALLTLVSGWAEYTTLQRSLNREVDNHLEQRASWVASELRAGRIPSGLMMPGTHALEEMGKLFVEIRRADGSLVANSSNLNNDRIPGDERPGSYFQDAKSPEGRPMRVRQLELPDRQLRVRVAESLELARLTLSHSLFRLALISLLGCLVAAWMSHRVLRLTFQPLQRVAGVARAITESGDMSLRVEVDPQIPEVTQVAQTLNRLLERVEQLLAAQSRLLEDTSHELRNPLMVLQMDLDVLAQSQVDEETRAEVSVEAKGELERIIRLVQDLLAISWAESSPQLNREPVQLDTFLDQLIGRYDGLKGERQIKVFGPPLRAYTDPSRLAQIVRNLVDNSIRYTRPTGRITLWILEKPPEAHPQLPSEGLCWAEDRLALVVQDDGCGIAEEHWASLFDRFFRIEADRNRKAGGTGLGLPVARALARALGGDLTVYSQPGLGSSFLLTLQRDQPEPDAPPEARG